VSLRFFTPWIATVGLKVYDAQGRTVRTLVSEPRLPGFYETAWDGRDDRGRALKPGLYYAELATPGYVMTREVVLVR
jgi:flagellar hook assembly protein FlgD